VRLLFRDAVTGQQVNDGFGLNLEFAGQLVNSDLIYVGHALRSRLSTLRLRLFRLLRIAFTGGGRNFCNRFRSRLRRIFLSGVGSLGGFGRL
jgi:hypothetical protein